MCPFVGIDFGATSSRIAYVDDTGEAVPIKNSDGSTATPSVVFFENPESIYVGEAAKRAQVLAPERAVAFFRQNMDDANTIYDMDGKSYRPEHIASFVVRRLTKDASELFGQPPTDAVLAVAVTEDKR